MTDMFNGCSKLEKINLSNFKTKDVTSMKRTFKGCFSLKSLDLSDFDTSNVIDMSEMFRECISLEFLNFLNFKNKKVKHFDKIFYLCNPLVYINISNSNSHNIDDITDKVFYNPGQNNINDLSELKNKYKNLNKKAINYISKNKFIEALACYENSYSISEKLKDKIKKRESECNVSIIYYYLNNKKIGYDLLKNYYYYFSDKFNKKNKNNFKILTLLCESGSYLCMSQILLFQDKDGCINLLKDIIKIISEEKNDNKIFCIKYLNNIIFNGIILLSENNDYNIHNLYENNIIDSSNIFNINNKQFYRTFCDFIAKGNIESWINFLDMINQEIKKLKNETIVVNLSFHKLMATCIKYMNENSEKNTSNKNHELAEVKLKLSSLIKNSYDKKNIYEKNINKIITEYNVKLKILKEIYEMLNNFDKNLFNDKISEKYLNKFYQNNKNKKEDNYFIISEYFIETSLLQINLIDNTEEAINEINNPKISSLVLSNMDLSHLDPGFINNINNNFIKMNKFNTIKSIYISSNKTKNISDNLDNFFGTAYSHICQGENITKINFKKKGSIIYFYQIDVKNGQLNYYVQNKLNKPKGQFDLNKIKKIKIGIKTNNVINKLDSIKLSKKNISQPYKFMSVIIIDDKKKEKTIDLVFETTKNAKYWFYGMYYYYVYVKIKPEKIYSCTKFILDRVKSKIISKLIDNDQKDKYKKKSFVYLIKKFNNKDNLSSIK